MMALLFASAISDSTLASVHSVPSGIVTLGDAAFRALLVACAVGAGLQDPGATPRSRTKDRHGGWFWPERCSCRFWRRGPAMRHGYPPKPRLSCPRTHGRSMSGRRVAGIQDVEDSSREPHAAPAPDPVSATETSLRARHRRPGRPDRGFAAARRRPIASLPRPSPIRRQSGTEPRGVGPFQTRYYLPLSDFLWMIYGSVALALLLRLFYGLGGAIGLWQSAEPVQIDASLADGLRLRSSRKISSPVTIGSAVVLPADYDEWDANKLRIVLAHERSHVRQGDFYLQALAGLYTAIFWFSPLGWWLKRKLSDLSEAISDHAGLEEAASHASYAQILLEFAALPRRTQVGVAMAHAGRISQRIERLLNEHSFRQAFAGGRRRLWATLLLVPAVLFAAAALIRVQAAQTLQQPVNALGPIVGQSHPESAPEAVQAPATAPTPAPAPQAEAPEDPVEAQAPAPGSSASSPGAPRAVAPAAPDVVPVPPIASAAMKPMPTRIRIRTRPLPLPTPNAGMATASSESSRSYSHVSDTARVLLRLLLEWRLLCRDQRQQRRSREFLGRLVRGTPRRNREGPRHGSWRFPVVLTQRQIVHRG